MTPEKVKEFEGYKAKAEKGDAKAQYALGVCYEQGLGVVVDFIQALAWYQKAAEQGHPAAQFNLDEVDELHPRFASADFEGADNGWRKEAEQGDAEAQFNLGFYYESRSDRRDYEVSFHNGCSEQGDEVYETEHFGGLASADNLQAVSWYRKAAEQGYAEAQYALGACYRNGRGVAKDFVQVVLWYRKAAEQGFTEAQYNLGLCYAKGVGVAKDVIEVYAYWSLAGITHEDARKNLTILEKRMSADQIAAGQKRAKELQKEIEAKIVAKAAGK